MGDGSIQLQTVALVGLEFPSTTLHAGSKKGGHHLQLQPYAVPWIQMIPNNRVWPLPATAAQQME